MSFDVEALKRQIPFYLTASREEFLRELESLTLAASSDYFLSDYDNPHKEYMLQGDGWRGFELYKFISGEKVSVRAVVISNSCDISLDNKQDIPANVVFSPLVKLSIYKNLLYGSGIDSKKVDEKIESIRAQKTNNLFYLPAGGGLEEEYVVRLDDIHSMPLRVHSESDMREKLFTLNMSGFYLFVFKLSVHFCRLQENIVRGPIPPEHKKGLPN